MGEHRYFRSHLAECKANGQHAAVMVIGESMSEHDHLIMVVEDDSEIRDLLRDALVDHGYQSIAATNGADALAQLRSRPQKPCLIVLDIRMPELNGWEFRRAQKADPDLGSIPLVLFTAHANATGVAEEMNAAGCLKKPATLEALLAMVELHSRHD
jgi:CheY-like chemotaxis protein